MPSPAASNLPAGRPGRIARARAQIRRMLAYIGAFAVIALVTFAATTGGVLATGPGTAGPTAASPTAAGPSGGLIGAGPAAASPAAASPAAASPGPPFPSPPGGASRVVDTANAFSHDARDNADSLIGPVEAVTGGQVIVYTQSKSVSTTAAAVNDAQALLAQWQPGGAGGRAAILLFDIDPSGQAAHAGLATSGGFATFLPEDERTAIVDDSMADYLAERNFDSALTAGLSRLSLDVQVMASGGCVGSACPTPGLGQPSAPDTAPIAGAPTGATAPTGPATSPAAAATSRPAATPRPTASAPAIPAGPPYPPPVTGRRVYDYAGVFKADTIARVQAAADAIEARTGAQVVVLTQLKPGVTTAGAEQDAIALIDQWGIGRKGFDDGLVILFDLDRTLRHGQVQLYAGPGFRAAFLTNAERQAIYQDDMLPYLRAADLDGAVLIAMSRVDAAATETHAQSLQFARQVNAGLGLIGAPLVFLLVGGWALFTWFRHGRDPHYLDDPSIYAAGPPADLTPASGAFILDGGPSRRALTTALLDLASRGELSFREAAADEPGRVGLDLVNGRADPAAAAIANARPIGAAEQAALEDLRVLGHGRAGGYLVGTDLQAFAGSVAPFNATLERQVIAGGWYREAPRIPRNRWLGRGVLEIFGGLVAWFVASFITSSGLGLVAGGLIAAGVLTFSLAFSMPTRTIAGAMIQAMLAAYRRTLAKTMAGARSLNQVVTEAHLPWLRTPDQAMVWATAVGLQSELATVLQRSLTDVRQNQALASTTYFPTWYVASSLVGSGAGALGGMGGSEPGGGMFSPSMVPDFGSMLAALGTIGNPPPSTSSGSSGGGSFSSGGSFGGGSSGGGGGGAGGGF